MAKKKDKKDELSLESVLWNCRVSLRGFGSTERNRDAVIGLVFILPYREQCYQRTIN